MKTYVLLTKVISAAFYNMESKENKDPRNVWIEQVKKECPEVRFISQNTLLGQYDFLDIYEAPNDEIAARVSFLSMKYTGSKGESLTVIPNKEFSKLTE